MKPTIAAMCGFFVICANTVVADELHEMSVKSDGYEFVITNQPCDIDFKEPTPFKYRGYVLSDKGDESAACWYGNDGGIWFAIDAFKTITVIDPNAFTVRVQKQIKGEF